MEITINSKQYPVSFTLAAFKNFCKLKNIDYDELDKVLAEILSGDFTVKTTEDFGDLLICGIKNGLRINRNSDQFDIDVDDAIDIIQNREELPKIVKMLVESLPEPEKTEESGNTQPAKENR